MEKKSASTGHRNSDTLQLKDDRGTADIDELRESTTRSSLPLRKSAAATTTTTEKEVERKETEDINVSAEAFILKFRQQLLLHRLESMENYQQMLARDILAWRL
ncbi:hypothetical protein Nepgr_017773 [Nepenthes gracilis]|uniref:Uncharacterized protein n=1 Tax=Nepenthes gracilis TaxID=150966 RepID=A0AAD3SSX5_NEPGR|nr:hypothetical protein Nepgr_017773 [Nepenthes gracilis]